MGQKIRISESELRKLIREAIENSIGNPTNPPTTAVAQPAVATNMVVNPQYAEAIKQAMGDIQGIKTMLGRFTRVPGAFYGIPEEKMKLFGTVFEYLTSAESTLANILQ